jgi:hypothetical protein
MSNHPTPTTNATMKEKAEVLGNDRRAATYAGRTSADLDLENAGRHAKGNTVIGADGVEYPTLPEGNPWRNDPTGVEPALGYSINDQEPTGETHEIQASWVGEADASVDHSPNAGGAEAPTRDVTSSRDVEPPTSLPKPKRRLP